MGLMYIAAMLVLLSAASGMVLDADKSRPVTKVLHLLKEMVDELQVEGEQDKEVYAEMGCWCETNDKEKSKAISDGEARKAQLNAAIEKLTGTSAQLNSQIQALSGELAKNEEALESGTALRKKQLAEFNAEEKDMLASVTSMKGAITALSKHHEASFLQESATRRMTMVTSLRTHLRRHADLMESVISPEQQRLLGSYFDGPRPAMIQTGASEAQPQSGEIFGILKGMKESFEKNLEASQREETANQAAYEDLKAAKTEEIAAGRNLIETKTQELAAADEKNAISKQDLDDTGKTLEEDVTFLATVRSKCESLDAEFEKRTKTRQLEVEAVNKALSFLTSDEAHDLLSRTFNMAFLQRQGSRLKRSQVSRVLAQASRHRRDPRLAYLQMEVRNAAFEKVVAQIQDMVNSLTIEQKDEAKLRDFCIEELHKNEIATEEKGRDEAELEAKVEDLSATVQELAKAIDDLTAAIAEARLQLKRAGEDRAKQNKDFQITVADQRATQKLLHGALNALKGFYGAALTQTAQPEFQTQEKNKKAGGVTSMIEGIIHDAEKLEAEAIRGEEDSQKAYEEFVKDTNDSIEAMKLNLNNKVNDKAKATTDKVERETELDGTKSEIKELDNADRDLHKRCDYTMKNFAIRQQARGDEIESLKQAISIFSGGSFLQFLQHPQ